MILHSARMNLLCISPDSFIIKNCHTRINQSRYPNSSQAKIVDIYLKVKRAHQYTQSNGCQCYELLDVNCILIMAGTNKKRKKKKYTLSLCLII